MGEKKMPPHVWGILLVTTVAINKNRVTPTQVYPHTCGEYLAWLKRLGHGRGLPPHRVTPTHVGNIF